MENNIKLGVPGISGNVLVEGRNLGYLDTPVTKIFIDYPDSVSMGELRHELSKRSWLSVDHSVLDKRTGHLKRKYLSGSSDMYMDEPIPTYESINRDSIQIGGLYLAPTDSSDGDDLMKYKSELQEFTELYNEYIMKKENNLGEYSRLVSLRDILSGTSEVCLLCPKDGSYTNIINTNSIQGNPVQLRIGVAFTREGEVFSKDIIIPTESYGSLSDGSKSDILYISSGTPDVTVEYSDGCIRLFPGTPGVTECIISYCYLTYEDLI